LDISLLQVRLSKERLLLWDLNVLVLGLVLLLVSRTAWKVVGLLPPSLILLGVPKWWGNILEVRCTSTLLVLPPSRT